MHLSNDNKSRLILAYYLTVFTGFCQFLDVENGNIGCNEDIPTLIGRECSVTCDEGYWSSVEIIGCVDVNTWSQIPICQGKQDGPVLMKHGS